MWLRVDPLSLPFLRTPRATDIQLSALRAHVPTATAFRGSPVPPGFSQRFAYSKAKFFT